MRLGIQIHRRVVPVPGLNAPYLPPKIQRQSFSPMETRFDDLGLSATVLKAIADAGYSHPTPIQAKSILPILMGRDLLGLAQTGTQTASFVLPMIDILAQKRARARMPRSLILSPTRELATQIAENFEAYSRYQALKMALLIGGTSVRDQKTS